MRSREPTREDRLPPVLYQEQARETRAHLGRQLNALEGPARGGVAVDPVEQRRGNLRESAMNELRENGKCSDANLLVPALRNVQPIIRRDLLFFQG